MVSIGRLIEAESHLSCAITQSSPKLDDLIIMDHVRASQVLLASYIKETKKDAS